MTKIGLLSDTHAWWDDRYVEYFKECDEIWLAGDIVSLDIAQRLEAVKPLRAVYGNADGTEFRQRYVRDLDFVVDGVRVLMTHIGGYPGKYDRRIYNKICLNPPQLLVCGHSHICKAVYDHNLHMLVLNPGAAGRYGQQAVRTLMRFVLDGGEIRDLDVIEMK